MNSSSVYKAMIQAMNTELGRLLAKVDLTKTLLNFMGDNGTPTNLKDVNGGVRGGKTMIPEGGILVPLLVAGAGVTRRGRESARVVSTHLFAAIGVAVGSGESATGNSFGLQPLLTGSAHPQDVTVLPARAPNPDTSRILGS